MGGDSAVLIEIVIFAMIAVFLVYRLRSVLGRRTGEERERPNPFSRPDAMPDHLSGRDTGFGRDTGGRDNVIPLPGRGSRPAPADIAEEPLSLAARLAMIGDADPDFDEKTFLGGARQAFSMIVAAFAHGDTETLRPLLADDVYDNFASAIQARQAAGETLETDIAAIRDADVVDARLDSRTAYLTIRFVSDQTNMVRNSRGEVVDGQDGQLMEVIDVWTFARNIRSRDPNWLLVETRSAS